MMIVGTIQQEVKSILSLSSILFITSIHPQNFLNLWVSSTKGLRQKLLSHVMREVYCLKFLPLSYESR